MAEHGEAIQTHNDLNDPMADIILRSTAITAEKSPIGEAELPHLFRMQKVQLLKLSTVLADMLVATDGVNMEHIDGLPVVQ